MSAPEAPATSAERVNEGAGLWCLGVAAVLAVAWTLIAAPGSDAPTSRILGEGFGKAGIPALVVWLVARSSRRRWPWWQYVVAVVVPTLLLSMLTGLQERVQDTSLTRKPHVTIGTPASLLGLTRTPVPKDRRAAMMTAFDKLAGQGEPVLGVYVRGSGGTPAVLLIGINTKPGGELDRDSRADTEQVLDEYMDGARITGRAPASAGRSGGSMSCGRVEPAPGQRYPVCAWAAPGRVGMVMFLEEQPMKQLAERTRRIRLLVERPARS